MFRTGFAIITHCSCKWYLAVQGSGVYSSYIIFQGQIFEPFLHLEVFYANSVNLKIKIYRTIILAVLLYGCESK